MRRFAHRLRIKAACRALCIVALGLASSAVVAGEAKGQWTKLFQIARGTGLQRLGTMEPGWPAVDSMAMDSAGNFYLFDVDRGRVVRLSPQGKYLRDYKLRRGDSVDTMAIDNRGDYLYAAEGSMGTMYRVSLKTGGVVTLSKSWEGMGDLCGLRGLCADLPGHLLMEVVDPEGRVPYLRLFAVGDTNAFVRMVNARGPCLVHPSGQKVYVLADAPKPTTGATAGRLDMAVLDVTKDWRRVGMVSLAFPARMARYWKTPVGVDTKGNIYAWARLNRYELSKAKVSPGSIIRFDPAGKPLAAATLDGLITSRVLKDDLRVDRSGNVFLGLDTVAGYSVWRPQLAAPVK